jgi:serine/threonine-protein kinase HipA
MNADAPYKLVDTLFLWYLGRPERPVLAGELNLVSSARGVSLRYDAQWLRIGFPLSEDLPLIDTEHLPREKDLAAGAVDDARPDRWGERVIRLLERPERLSLLEMLFFAGDDRFGALGVSTSREAYQPRSKLLLPQFADVNDVHALVRKVLAGERIDESQRRLIAPGATMGGARPKALLQIAGVPWVLKFAEEERSPEPLIEHAAMSLASKADIRVAQTRAIKLKRGFAVAVKRFDRTPGLRLHALSAHVALKAAGADLSYPSLAQLLRRRGDTQGGVNQHQMRELFRRLIYNILIDNTDDHEKNHVLLVTDAQNYHLAPAFDVLPTQQALGYQAMNVGADGAVSTIDNALSMCHAYGLKRLDAIGEAAKVAKVVNKWRSHFKAKGVDANTIDSLSAQIDRSQLLAQRRGLIV